MSQNVMLYPAYGVQYNVKSRILGGELTLSFSFFISPLPPEIDSAGFFFDTFKLRKKKETSKTNKKNVFLRVWPDKIWDDDRAGSNVRTAQQLLIYYQAGQSH